MADRAFVDAHYWDQQKRKLKVTVITRMKSNLVIESTQEREIADSPLYQGVICDEEKCFDTWKNDFSQGKAWGRSRVAIESQTRLAIITHLLVTLLLTRRMGGSGISDEKSLKKRAQRIEKRQAEFVPMICFSDLYRHTAKVSRRALRFLRSCFHRSRLIRFMSVT